MTKNMFYKISDDILRSYLMEKFEDLIEDEDGDDEHLEDLSHFEMYIFDKDIRNVEFHAIVSSDFSVEFCDTRMSPIEIKEQNDGILFTANDLDKSVEMYLEESKDHHLFLNMIATVDSKCAPGSEFDFKTTEYETCCREVYSYDRVMNTVIVVMPTAEGAPPFALVTDLKDIVDTKEHTLTSDMISLLSGYSCEGMGLILDSRNENTEVTISAKKKIPAKRVDAPIYRIQQIPMSYQDEFVEYDDDGNVIYYRNDRNNVKYTRFNKGDLGIEETISIKDIVISQRVTLSSDNNEEKIMIDVLNGYAHVITADLGGNGMVYIPQDKQEYVYEAANQHNNLTELGKRAIAIMEGLPKPTIEYSDEMAAHIIKYSNGRHVFHYTDNKISTDIYYDSQDNQLYKLKTIVLEDGEKCPIDIDSIDSDVLVMTTFNGGIRYSYRIDGTKYEFLVSTYNNVRMCMQSYESKEFAVAYMQKPVHKLIVEDWVDNYYVRGAFGVPHKLSPNFIIEEIL